MTVSGLVKLLFPDPQMPIPDGDLEWMLRLALESRRRVKEQQNLKRLTDDDWWHAGGAGFEIAAGGPETIGKFLTILQRTYPYGRSGNEGPQALFGRLYQALEFGHDDPAYDPVRKVLAEHIRTHLPLGPGETVFGIPVERPTLHSVRTLALESRLTVTNGVDVDRHPLDAIARAGTSEELPAMRTTETIEEYDLVAFRDNVEHLGSRIGDRLIEHLVELSPTTRSDLGADRGKAEIPRSWNSG
jgi:hypothetical protein